MSGTITVPGTRRITGFFESAAVPSDWNREPDYGGSVPGTVTLEVVDGSGGTTVYSDVTSPAIQTATNGDGETFHYLELEIGTATVGSYSYQWFGDAAGSGGVVATVCGSFTAEVC